MRVREPAQALAISVEVGGGVFHRGQDQDRAGAHRRLRSGTAARGEQQSNHLRNPRPERTAIARALA